MAERPGLAVDALRWLAQNWSMATQTTPADVLADLEAILKRLTSGTPIEPELASRVRVRSERMTEELRREHGELHVAVDLIREVRDEE
jgi:hypothetical protein